MRREELKLLGEQPDIKAWKCRKAGCGCNAPPLEESRRVTKPIRRKKTGLLHKKRKRG
jgi:hypothetical protein